MSTWLNVLLAVLLIVSPVGPSEDAPHELEPAAYLPLIAHNAWSGPAPLLISALFYDTYLTDEPDEAFQIYNPTGVPVSLAGWQLSSGSRTVTFPADMMLAAHARLWCARSASHFVLSFGYQPEGEYAEDTAPDVPDLTGSAPRFSNTGGRITLTSPDATYADVLVYEGGDTTTAGWQGPAVYPYQPAQSFGVEGQVLYRKPDQRSGLPVSDTDTRGGLGAGPGGCHRWPQGPVPRLGIRSVLSAGSCHRERHSDGLRIAGQCLCCIEGLAGGRAQQHPLRGVHLRERTVG